MGENNTPTALFTAGMVAEWFAESEFTVANLTQNFQAFEQVCT